MELDSNFEPQVDDLMEEEDPGIQDDEWEPEFKKPRIKKENTDIAGRAWCVLVFLEVSVWMIYIQNYIRA